MIGRTQKSSLILAAASIATIAVGYSRLQAADVILNGGLENSAGPNGWTLTHLTASSLQQIVSLSGCAVREHRSALRGLPVGRHSYARADEVSNGVPQFHRECPKHANARSSQTSNRRAPFVATT